MSSSGLNSVIEPFEQETVIELNTIITPPELKALSLLVHNLYIVLGETPRHPTFPTHVKRGKIPKKLNRREAAKLLKEFKDFKKTLDYLQGGPFALSMFYGEPEKFTVHMGIIERIMSIYREEVEPPQVPYPYGLRGSSILKLSLVDPVARVFSLNLDKLKKVLIQAIDELPAWLT